MLTAWENVRKGRFEHNYRERTLGAHSHSNFAFSLFMAVCVFVQAAQRALIVTKEKAANEAKSEFMSLMCHEVRTPLNGALQRAILSLLAYVCYCL